MVCLGSFQSPLVGFDPGNADYHGSCREAEANARAGGKEKAHAGGALAGSSHAQPLHFA